MQIIPAIDILGGKTVRLLKGEYQHATVYNTDPVDMVKLYLDYGLTRIHSVDLDGAKASNPINLRVLEKMALVDGAEIEWSGGLKSDISVADAFNAGAAYICGGSIAVSNPEVFENWLKVYGADKVILGADIREGHISVKGWTEDTDETIENLIDRFLPFGLNQAVVTDISRDGTLQGIDCLFYENLQKRNPSVIFTISGGVSSIKDIENAVRHGLKRVIVGKAVYENKISLAKLRDLNLK